MCLFAVAYGILPDLPLLALANRDEFRSRPTAPPRIVREEEGQVAWLGGLDLEAGGTWLGVNPHGLLVAITNRKKSAIPAQVRSRGWLCRDLLQCSSTASALDEAKRLLATYAFNGFNLLLMSAESASVIESADETLIRALPPGLHVIANGPLDDLTDARVQWARVELAPAIGSETSLDGLVAETQRLSALCCENVRDSICRPGGEWGTVSSTIIALTSDPARARYLYAGGPPSEAAFADFSSQLRELLQTQLNSP